MKSSNNDFSEEKDSFKLVETLFNKTRSLCQTQSDQCDNPKFHMGQGLINTKVHRAFRFQPSYWQSLFIDKDAKNVLFFLAKDFL